MATTNKPKKVEINSKFMAKINPNDTVSFKVSELKLMTKDSVPVQKYPILFDERVEFKVNESLAKSLESDGQIQPILVTLFEDEPGIQTPYVVVGNQRTKAAYFVRPDFEIKAIVIPFDVKQIVFLRITENEQRVNNTPVIRAKQVARLRDLKDEAGNEIFTAEDLSIRYGVSTVQIYNWLTVAKALSYNIAGLKDAVDSERLKSTTLVSMVKAATKEDGTVDKTLLKEAFDKAIEVAGEGNKVTNRIASEASDRKVKPKAEDIRKLLSFKQTPFTVELVVSWILGDRQLDEVMALARANGVEMEWLTDALSSEVVKEHNAKGAGRKAKAKTAEAELLS